jgi:hypothetical protein
VYHGGGEGTSGEEDQVWGEGSQRGNQSLEDRLLEGVATTARELRQVSDGGEREEGTGPEVFAVDLVP